LNRDAGSGGEVSVKLFWEGPSREDRDDSGNGGFLGKREGGIPKAGREKKDALVLKRRGGVSGRGEEFILAKKRKGH